MAGENIFGCKADEVTVEEALPLHAHCVCIYPCARNSLKGQFLGLIYAQHGAFGKQHVNLLLISKSRLEQRCEAVLLPWTAERGWLGWSPSFVCVTAEPQQILGCRQHQLGAGQELL